MREEVTLTFQAHPPVRVDLSDVQPMPMGCESLRPTGKLLTADKVLVVAQAGGAVKFADAKWALEFARAASAALGKPRVAVDVAAMTLSY